MKIISFSGIDGSGKSTQIDFIKNYYNNQNKTYRVIWARASWTPGVELVKMIVRQDRGFTEEQKEDYRKEARTNLKKQKIILILSILDLYWFFGFCYRILSLFSKVLICDRYIWDTVVDFRVNFSHYNYEDWTLWKLLMKIIPNPSPSFVFVISAKQSVERGLIKQEAHMESLEVKMQKTEEYMKLIREGKWSNVIDGNMNSSRIHELVKEALANEDR